MRHPGVTAGGSLSLLKCEPSFNEWISWSRALGFQLSPKTLLLSLARLPRNLAASYNWEMAGHQEKIVCNSAGVISIAIRFFGQPEIPKSSGWFGIVREFQSLGIEVVKPESGVVPSALLVIDYVRKDEKRWPPVQKAHRFLVATEPVTVNPGQFTRRVSNKFTHVIVPSQLAPKNPNTLVYEGGYMNSNRYLIAYDNDGGRKGVGLINENKFSFVSQSQYALRTQFILECLVAGTPIRIAGRNWTRGFWWTAFKLSHHIFIAARAGVLAFRLSDVLSAFRLSNHRGKVVKLYEGVVDDSLEFLSNCKVAVVIENEASYASEKLHGALMAGCQCVYVGPPLDPRDFPSGFLFQARPHPADILSQVKLAEATPYAISRAEIFKLVQSGDFFQSHSVELRNQWVAKTISERLNSSQPFP